MKMKMKMTIGLVIFLTTFLVLASVTPIQGDLEVEFEVPELYVPPEIYEVTDLYDDAYISDELIETATVGGSVALLDQNGDIVEEVAYRDIGGTIIQYLPESFVYYGMPVMWLRISITWVLPTVDVEWNFLDVECNLYHAEFETGFIASMHASDKYFGVMTFPDILLDDYFDIYTAGEQTRYFKAVMVMHGEVIVDGGIGSFDRRFVEDVPVSIRNDIPDAFTDTLFLEDPELYLELIDEKEIVTDIDSLSDVNVIQITTIPGTDEEIWINLDFEEDPNDLMSFFGGADSPLTTVQQLMLLAGIVTVVVVIFSDGKGQKALKDLAKQLGKIVPKQIRW